MAMRLYRALEFVFHVITTTKATWKRETKNKFPPSNYKCYHFLVINTLYLLLEYGYMPFVSETLDFL